jgi:predicted nucleic acid-binding protein
MMMVDTNVLLDVYKADMQWMPWSLAELQRGRLGPGLATNMVVYAELAGHPGHPQGVDEFLDALSIQVVDLTRPAAHLAGQAFRQYRQRGGTKTGVLPDFFIGAHAQTQGWTLLTRDGARYRTYFPELAMVCP